MRLKSGLWVQGYLQKLSATMVPAFIVRRGHDSAGAIYIKVNLLNSSCHVFSPAPASFSETPQPGQDDRRWSNTFGTDPISEKEADTWLQEQVGYDQDAWIIETEDRRGASHLEDYSLVEF